MLKNAGNQINTEAVSNDQQRCKNQKYLNAAWFLFDDAEEGIKKGWQIFCILVSENFKAFWKKACEIASKSKIFF